VSQPTNYYKKLMQTWSGNTIKKRGDTLDKDQVRRCVTVQFVDGIMSVVH
jgi:hypothetical protein